MLEQETLNKLKGYCEICGKVTAKGRSKFCSTKCFKIHRRAYHRELMRRTKGYTKRYKKKSVITNFIEDCNTSGTGNIDFSLLTP